jgi:hypothetical protein
VSGVAPPLLNQQGGRGPPIRRGSYEGANRVVWDPDPRPGNQIAHRGARLGISGPYGICPARYDDKPHIPHQKIPGLQTPKSLISGPEALSHSLRMGNTRDSGAQTFSTKEGPTASSTEVPSDKDELNSVPPHVGQLGLAAILQKHRLPSGRTGGIGMPHLAQPITQGKAWPPWKVGPTRKPHTEPFRGPGRPTIGTTPEWARRLIRKTSPPRNDRIKQPLEEPTRELTPLPPRRDPIQTERGLEDSRIGLNTVEASNRVSCIWTHCSSKSLH